MLVVALQRTGAVFGFRGPLAKCTSPGPLFERAKAGRPICRKHRLIGVGIRRHRDVFAATSFKKVRAGLTLPPAFAWWRLLLFPLALHPDVGGCGRALDDRGDIARLAIPGRRLGAVPARVAHCTWTPVTVLRSRLPLRPSPLVALFGPGVARFTWPPGLRGFGCAWSTLWPLPRSTSPPAAASAATGPAILPAVLRGLSIAGHLFPLRFILSVRALDKCGRSVGRLKLLPAGTAALAAAAARAPCALFALGFSRSRRRRLRVVMSPIHLHHGRLAGADLRLRRALDDKL